MADPADDFLRDVQRGLGRKPKSLPCKYLYDARGSALFESICETEEYYVTRADLALHERHLDALVEAIGPDAHLIEFGAGAGVKTRMLLAAADRPRAYTPIEISATALDATVERLRRELPDLDIRPLKADYTAPIPGAMLELEPPAQRRVIYFPGSTISNFDYEDAASFMRRMARMVGPGGGALIGVDLLKSAERLKRAYDDAKGVTAAFNLNLLARMQTELGARLRPQDFIHEARFNSKLGRIEMHLVAVRPTQIQIGPACYTLAAEESIHTENSYKYSVEAFQSLARLAGLQPETVWLDPLGLFSMHYLIVPPATAV